MATQLISQHVRLAGKRYRAETPAESVDDSEVDQIPENKNNETKRLRRNPRRVCTHSSEAALVNDHEPSHQSTRQILKKPDQRETRPFQVDKNAQKQVQSTQSPAHTRRTRLGGPKYRCYAPGCKRFASRQRGNLITHFKEGAHPGIKWDVKLVGDAKWSDDEDDASPTNTTGSWPNGSSARRTAAGPTSAESTSPGHLAPGISSFVLATGIKAKKDFVGHASKKLLAGPHYRDSLPWGKSVGKGPGDTGPHIMAGRRTDVAGNVNLTPPKEFSDSGAFARDCINESASLHETSSGVRASRLGSDTSMLEPDSAGDLGTSGRASETSWSSWDQPEVSAYQDMELQDTRGAANNGYRASMSSLAETLYPEALRQTLASDECPISPKTQPVANQSNAGMAADFPADDMQHKQEARARTFISLSSTSPTCLTSRGESGSPSPSLPGRGTTGNDQHQQTVERQGALIGVLDEENVRLRDRCHDLKANFVAVAGKVKELRQLLGELEEMLGAGTDE